jgi:cytosine/uracil/thiamine/allantoin permease
MASNEKNTEGLVLPSELGNGESYTVSNYTGRRGWNPFTNFHLVVAHQSSSFSPNSKWSNKGTPSSIPSKVDLDPILPQNRTWRTYNYVAYWVSDAFVVSIW